MTLTVILITAAAVALAAFLLTGLAVRVLTARAVLDRPNARSSHAVPTPRGGGIAVLAALVPGLALLAVLSGEAARLWPALLGLVLLAGVSFADDLSSLSARLRLLAQAIAVGLGMVALPEASLTQGLVPLALERLVLAVGWLWFINLFNFMDGIDGITAVETIAVGLGAGLSALLLGAPGLLAALGLVTAAGAAGFLPQNWHPARIFLGDVGSVPLGYLLGFILLWLALAGAPAAALALPLYYLADATLTLLKRLGRGERVWQAHREHWYQRAAAATRHDRVSLAVAAANAAVVAVAAATVLLSPALIALAGLVVWGLIGHLGRLAGGPRGPH